MSSIASTARGEHRVELATPAHIPVLEVLLASVFVDDEALAWMVPDRAVRQRTLPGFFRAILRGTMRHGRALRAPDTQAVSLWRLPGRVYPGWRESLRGLPAMFPFVKHAGPRARVLANAVREHAPRAPFRYLQFVGVALESQGTGRGGAVIRAGLEDAARAGEPVYLETAKPQNVSLYQRYGFEVTEEWSVPGGGPTFTSLLKRP